MRQKRQADQAHVEREHRTLLEWLEQPQPLANLKTLQTALDEARYMDNYVLPSDAGDCQGRPLMEVHPEVLHPLRPYHPAAELDLLDLARVDRFLAQFNWSYQVSKTGQFRIAKHTYSVGKAHAGQRVDVRSDPHDRYFVFREGQSGKTIKRCPIKGLDVATITGLDAPAIGDLRSSLPFPPSVDREQGVTGKIIIHLLPPSRNRQDAYSAIKEWLTFCGRHPPLCLLSGWISLQARKPLH